MTAGDSVDSAMFPGFECLWIRPDSAQKCFGIFAHARILLTETECADEIKRVAVKRTGSLKVYQVRSVLIL